MPSWFLCLTQPSSLPFTLVVLSTLYLASLLRCLTCISNLAKENLIFLSQVSASLCYFNRWCNILQSCWSQQPWGHLWFSSTCNPSVYLIDSFPKTYIRSVQLSSPPAWIGWSWHAYPQGWDEDEVPRVQYLRTTPENKCLTCLILIPVLPNLNSSCLPIFPSLHSTCIGILFFPPLKILYSFGLKAFAPLPDTLLSDQYITAPFHPPVWLNFTHPQ